MRCGNRSRDGATTFLFSDIESSTRRWESDPAAMEADLALHDRLLHDAVRSTGGVVFSHTGDGLAAAFDDPVAALEAALRGQVSMAGAEWAGASPLRVRMGVHTGPAQRRASNYFGPTLNRTARMMSVGSGGQVLCSQATADLTADGLPAGVALLDLGEHRLADLAQPERVFQLLHPDLPETFAPLRSLAAHRNNLPVALTSFVGRTDELKELEDLVDGNRLVTLTGVGGAGKTRLALQVAAGGIDRYPDGVWLVELARIRDGSLLGPAIAGAMGVDIMGRETADAVEAHLIAHLTAKRVLLVLDNCEHLLDPVARFVHQLLTRSRELTVLATSRENLGLPGEATWQVLPLSLPASDAVDVSHLLDSDAVLFFWERARTARPGFELGPANAADVARICRRLEGIPLALELAAARVRVLGVQEIAERLEDSFALLTGGPRTSLPHHQTLRAALDWSHDLLPEVERAAFRRLAVFPASFPLDAAEAVMLALDGAPPTTGDGSDAVGLLARLVDQSLVVVSDDGAEHLRYRLLGPVRRYARDRLVEAGEEHATLRRHRDFCTGLSKQWGIRLFEPERIGRVTSDAESFRAALEWSWREGDLEASLQLVSALWPVWFFGNPAGARGWLERVVERTADLAVAARVEALAALAAFLPATPGRQQELLTEAYELVQRLDDQEGIAALDFVAGERALRAGDFATARVELDKALARFRALGYEAGMGECHAQLGWLAVGEADLERARREFRCAAELAGDHGPDLVAQVESALAALSVLAGDVEQGLRLAGKALATAEHAALRMTQVMVMVRAGETAMLAGDMDRAVRFLADGIDTIAELGTDRYLGDCLELLALVQVERDRPARAALLFGAADAVHEATGGASAARFIAATAGAARAQLVSRLGREQVERSEREGRSLSPEQVLERARECLG